MRLATMRDVIHIYVWRRILKVSMPRNWGSACAEMALISLWIERLTRDIETIKVTLFSFLVLLLGLGLGLRHIVNISLLPISFSVITKEQATK